MTNTFKILIEYKPGDEFPWHARALGASVWAQGKTPGEAADGVNEEMGRNGWKLEEHTTGLVMHATVPQ